MKKNESFKWILFSSVKLGTQKRSVCTKNSECQTHAKEPRADTEQEESFMYSHVHVHTSFFSLIAAFNVRCSCFLFLFFFFALFFTKFWDWIILFYRLGGRPKLSSVHIPNEQMRDNCWRGKRGKKNVIAMAIFSYYTISASPSGYSVDSAVGQSVIARLSNDLFFPVFCLFTTRV
jgi:hypothetical protein